MKDESENGNTLYEMWKDMPHDVEPYQYKLPRKDVIEMRIIDGCLYIICIGLVIFALVHLLSQ